jgi:hypothetical protein
MTKETLIKEKARIEAISNKTEADKRNLVKIEKNLALYTDVPKKK